VLDLVHPIRAGRRLGIARRDAGDDTRLRAERDEERLGGTAVEFLYVKSLVTITPVGQSGGHQEASG
jgi:hypothetical protein